VNQNADKDADRNTGEKQTPHFQEIRWRELDGQDSRQE
jgi:hypothetical protein